MLKNASILVVILLLLSGCATTIQMNGKPVPEHTYTQTNPRTGIRADLLCVRYTEKIEGKEKFLYPIYFELNKEIIIPGNTKSVYMVVEIINTSKVSYTLTKKYTVWDGTPYPCKVTQVISISKQPNRVHQILLPYMKGIKVDFGLQLSDSKGNFIMNVGQAKYTVRGGDRDERK